MSARRLGAAAVLLPVVLLTAACGGGDGSSTASAATPTAAPTASGGSGRGFDPAEFQQIRDCLTAAGIAVPTGRPSGGPNGTPPSGMPTGPRPSGAPDGARGGGMFSSPEAEAAIKACGLSVPTFGPRPSATRS